MKQAELEETLRATLAGRAETVTRGPDWRVPAGSPLSTRRRAVRWLAPLAAAAAVAAVVLSVVAIEHHSGGRHLPPATQHPTHTVTNSSPTTSTAPPPAPTVPLACRATLPAEWAQAIHSSLLDVGGTTAMPLSVTPDGGILVARDFGPIPGSPRDIVLVERGRAPQVVYQVPDPDTYDVSTADQVGRRLVVALRVLSRPRPGEIPGSASNDVHRIVVIDLHTNQQRVVASTSLREAAQGGKTITTMATIGGAVYWDERSKYVAQTGEVEKYDLATGQTSIVYRGRLGYPVASAAGFGLAERPTERIEAPVAIPAVVASATDPRMRATLTTDGTAWAWIAGPHEIGWWSEGSGPPTSVRLRGPALTGPDYYPNGPVVSGRYVFVNVGSGQIVDMISRAASRLPAYQARTRGSISALSGPFGTLVGEVEFGAAGHFVQGYWQDTPSHVLRLDTRGLPGLSC